MSAAPEIRRVLQALRLNRTPGWSLPARYLGLSFDSLTAERARISLPLDASLDREGQVVLVAACVLADLALAGALRGRAGGEARIATVGARLNFTGARASSRLQAISEGVFEASNLAVPMAGARVSIASGDAVLCTGEGSFAVMDNRKGTAPHPMAQGPSYDEIEPLALSELSEPEQEVVRRARIALDTYGKGAGSSYLDAFWGLSPTVNDAVGECLLECGMHVGNRIGDVQGGILLGLAACTSAAVPGPGWHLLELSAQFLAPGKGSHVRARAEVLRAGSNVMFLSCDVTDASGRPVLRACVTMVRQASSLE